MDALAALAAAKAQQRGKAMIAPGGWVFLANDAHDFLSWQFGARTWSAAERERVAAMMRARVAALAPATYLMLPTPEKSVVYADWLPHGLDRLAPSPDRPAAWLAASMPGNVCYPADRLMTLKRLGLLYFRGDTHVNWLGAYHVYRQAVDALRAAGVAIPPPLDFGMLKAAPAGFEGDLYVQIDEEQRAAFQADPASGRWNDMLELTLQLALRPGRAQATTVERPADHVPAFRGRQVVIKRHADQSLPRALVFGDSTASYLIDFLAEHFSRSVFVWHDKDVVADFVETERPDVVLHLVAERFLAPYPDIPAIGQLG